MGWIGTPTSISYGCTTAFGIVEMYDGAEIRLCGRMRVGGGEQDGRGCSVGTYAGYFFGVAVGKQQLVNQSVRSLHPEEMPHLDGLAGPVRYATVTTSHWLSFT